MLWLKLHSSVTAPKDFGDGPLKDNPRSDGRSLEGGRYHWRVRMGLCAPGCRRDVQLSWGRGSHLAPGGLREGVCGAFLPTPSSGSGWFLLILQVCPGHPPWRSPFLPSTRHVTMGLILLPSLSGVGPSPTLSEPLCHAPETHMMIKVKRISHFTNWMISWRWKWQPTPVFLPGESHGQRSLEGYSPWDCKESDMTEWLNTHTHRTKLCNFWKLNVYIIYI